MKRIVSIQDISCFGKCSLTVALPLLSAMGVETAIVPTAVLSTHTLLPGFHCHPLDSELPAILEHWKKLELNFDAIYTGYLASSGQIEFVKSFFSSFQGSSPLRFVDPAMADNGKLYTGFSKEFPAEMTSLCGIADIIVPNLTEAALMTGMDYREDYDESYIKEMLFALSALGTKHAVVLTGVSTEKGMTGVYGMYVKDKRFFSFSHEKIGRSYHGTGDIFSSVALGGIQNGLSLEKALELAALYTGDCIQETYLYDREKSYGVNFETVIPKLLKRLDSLKKIPC